MSANDPYYYPGGYGAPLPTPTANGGGGTAGTGGSGGGGVLGSLGGAGGIASLGIGAGTSILGSLMQGQAANTAANRQWQLIQNELSRRNGIQAGMAPGLMTSAGITDPGQRAAMLASISGASVGEGGGMQQPTVTPNHLLPGQAHNNASDIVSKVENPFGQAMANIVKTGGSLSDLKSAYQSYLTGINAFKSSGGANAQVAQQSLTNPKLAQTFNNLWTQLGGGKAPILGS